MEQSQSAVAGNLLVETVGKEAAYSAESLLAGTVGMEQSQSAEAAGVEGTCFGNLLAGA